MLIVQFSSVFNHHSLEFADAMYKLCDGQYYFVETCEEEKERKELGYHPYERPYLIKYLENDESRLKAEQLALDADVMIAGVFPYPLLKRRLEKKKLTFLCQERIFKGSQGFLRKIRVWQYCLRKYGKYKSLYLLSIGENCARDYHRICFFKNKSFLWGYFPLQCAKPYAELTAAKKHTRIEILFVGRLIELKHPQYTIDAVKELIEAGMDLHLSVVGDGVLREQLEDYVEANSLNDAVTFWGSMSPEQVQILMEKANVLTFTSNSLEGWGAVISEAMGTACAVVASETAGATTTLIRDGYNGFIYGNDSYGEFREKLKALLRDPQKIELFGKNAYDTMHEVFCARIAAERFISVCEAILRQNSPPRFSEGPMKLL